MTFASATQFQVYLPGLGASLAMCLNRQPPLPPLCVIVKTDGLFAALVPTLPGGVVCGQLGGLSGWLPDPEQTL